MVYTALAQLGVDLAQIRELPQPLVVERPP